MEKVEMNQEECVLSENELAKLDEAIALRHLPGIPMEDAFANAEKRAKARLEARKSA